MLNTLVETKKVRDRLNPANQREAVTIGRESVGLATELLTLLLFKRTILISSVLSRRTQKFREIIQTQETESARTPSMV